MAEPLKDRFGPPQVEAIADMIESAVVTGDGFDRAAFVTGASDGLDDLELTPRISHVAAAMADHLPSDRGRALRILIDSLPDDAGDEGSMSEFVLWPYSTFVAERGDDDLDAALELQYEVTKRFTSEFSIRAFLVGRHRDATLARLAEWVDDPDEHVRRLVSEGTRPRLPWAPRLGEFVDDPTPVIGLLERLRHDRSEYVRRSVANNLNDIAKDHPELVVDVCARWWSDPDPELVVEERRMIRHALRTLVKRGDPAALAVLGFGADSPARLGTVVISPDPVAIGGRVRIDAEIEHPEPSAHAEAGALVDLVVHFVKANGSTSAKVFKGAELQLAPGERRTVSRSVSVAQHSTRTHYPGVHRVDVQINGVAVEAGAFTITAPD